MPVVITIIIIVMLLSVAAGVVFIKKYICGGRFVNVCTDVLSTSCDPYFRLAK